MNPRGANQRQLTVNDVSDEFPNWSPDGRRIAFHSDPFEVSTMRSDGSNQTRLTFNTGGQAAWSPDGRRIAFISFPDGNGETVHDAPRRRQPGEPDRLPGGGRLPPGLAAAPRPPRLVRQPTHSGPAVRLKWSRAAGLGQSGSTRVAAAFQVATTRAPGSSSSSRADGSVISAVSGCGAAIPTRMRLPTAVMETTSASRWFCAEPVRRRPGGASATSHG